MCTNLNGEGVTIACLLSLKEGINRTLTLTLRGKGATPMSEANPLGSGLFYSLLCYVYYLLCYVPIT